MKLLLLIPILLLTSCQQYRYDVSYEKCNGQTGSFISATKPVNMTWRHPEGGGTVVSVNSTNFREIQNICDLSYTSTPIK